MPTTVLGLLKNIHSRMGYPLGKAHYKMQMLAEKLNQPGSPTRHVRRIAYKLTHPAEVLTRRLRARHFTHNLEPKIADHAKELRETGFTYFTNQVDPELLKELNTYYEAVLANRSEAANASSSHPFFFPLTDESDITTDSILVRFALQEEILKAATAYFGCVPYLGKIHVQESRGIETPRWTASQQWHLDYSPGGDDLISLWVYLTDVDTLDQGPFTFIPISGSRKVKNDFLPRRIRDEEIEAAGLSGQVRRAMGPRFTSFFMNSTKCYHMGSRLAKGEKRVIYVVEFLKPVNERNQIKVTTAVEENQKLLISR